MKDSEVLIKARALIEAREKNRVCYAIDSAAPNWSQADRLTNWVQKSLDGMIFYEDWVIRHHPKFAKQKGITSWKHQETLRPGRIAWLTWMIEQCQAEEAKS